MNYMLNMVHWFTHNPLSAAAVFFGTAIVVVTLYTYIHDYRMLTDQD